MGVGERQQQMPLPFDEHSADEPEHAPAQEQLPSTSPARTTARKATSELPASLRAFADFWGVREPAAAMMAACADLRTRAGQQRAPYALTPMLDALSAQRAVATGSGAHGRLKASRDGWTVYRRADVPWRRVRFTEAHEIGHILVYEALSSNRAWLDDLHARGTHERLERLCDIGATELLMPATDLAADLRARPLEDVATYQRLYDRYLVSQTALLRRVCEVSADTAMTKWTWRDHNRGADWRIASSYTSHLDGLYIPKGLSRRRLDPDVVARALEDGSATAVGALEISASRWLESSMTAIRPRFRQQTELPVYLGHSIGDEPDDDCVFLLHRGLRAVTVRRPRFPRRRAS